MLRRRRSEAAPEETACLRNSRCGVLIDRCTCHTSTAIIEAQTRFLRAPDLGHPQLFIRVIFH
jgi:hypothetical protein